MGKFEIEFCNCINIESLVECLSLAGNIFNNENTDRNVGELSGIVHSKSGINWITFHFRSSSSHSQLFNTPFIVVMRK